MPLACRPPKICDGFWSLMRLTTTELTEGWLKMVVSPAAMLKLCQFKNALCEVVMVSRGPLVVAVALPPATVMPVGLARVFAAKAHSKVPASARRNSESREKTFIVHPAAVPPRRGLQMRNRFGRINFRIGLQSQNKCACFAWD